MPNTEDIKMMIQDSIDMKIKMKDLAPMIMKCVDIIVDAYKNGKKVLIFGNGGSAADAQHIAAELVSKFFLERKALPCIALTTNTSILTAIGNDYSYDMVFKRQVEAFLQPGDVIIGISTSGNSRNVVEAIKYAKDNKAKTIAFVGSKQCQLDDLVDISLKMPSTVTPRIQEGHITAGHIICQLVEAIIFGQSAQK